MSTAAGIYARELFSLGYGYPMWCPEPCPREIRLGDVGYLRDGQFHILFNTMPSTRAPGDAVTAASSEETTNVPEVYPPNFVEFVPPRETIVHASKRLIQRELHCGSLRSTSVSASASAGCVSAIAIYPVSDLTYFITQVGYAGGCVGVPRAEFQVHPRIWRPLVAGPTWAQDIPLL